MTIATSIILGIWFFAGMSVFHSKRPIYDFIVAAVALVITVLVSIVANL